jgi:hypothetical protein
MNGWIFCHMICAFNTFFLKHVHLILIWPFFTHVDTISAFQGSSSGAGESSSMDIDKGKMFMSSLTKLDHTFVIMATASMV